MRNIYDIVDLPFCMKIGYLQFEPRFGRVKENLQTIADLIRACDLDLVVLPELCTTGYSFLNKQEVRKYAEPVEGESTQLFIALAAECDITIVFSMVEVKKRKYFISSIIASRDGVMGVYRKRKLAQSELQLFKPGKEKPQIYTVNGYRLGLMICVEFRYPEIFAELVELGAEIICHSANSGTTQSMAIMEEYSKQYGVISISANRLGKENRGQHKYNFIGCSQIIIPMESGEVRNISMENIRGCRGFDLRDDNEKASFNQF